ncbi:hypothetical protein WJX82_000278 [Trebouxia sp. C0006]
MATGQAMLHSHRAPPQSSGQRACLLHTLAQPALRAQNHSSRAERLVRKAAQVDSEVRQRLETAGGVVTDQAVPEGHKGLHGFLYGEGGAEEHDSQSRYNFREGQDDGTSSMSVEEYLQTRDGEKPLGVYALYNAHNAVQYIGYSRNMVLAVKNHLQRVGEARCAFVRAMVFANAAMASRTNLEREMYSWIDREGVIPSGNGPEKDLWDGQATAKVMSPAEMAEYEEKKLKMRKAMGENLHDDVQGEEPDSKQRRLNLIKAVEGDDWSAVIDSQTQQTIEDGLSPESSTSESDTVLRTAHLEQDEAIRQDNRQKAQQQKATTRQVSGPNGQASPIVAELQRESDEANRQDSLQKAQEQKAQDEASREESLQRAQAVVSPFTRATVHRQIGSSHDYDDDEELPPLTPYLVDKALDEVRPYLIADGGNVEVAAVQDGVVMLRLQGACGTCPSSTATMKMGIERSLRATFGEQLLEVQQVDQIDTSASVESVNSHLDMLRPAIQGYGGSVEVLAVDDGICEVKYEGPAPIGMGIQAAIKDKFPDIRVVELL